ncbi:TauD/TfdA family dioxygenase [Nonomuraea sp. NPDC050394]|uniref:TauD/TfdA family dioxygenase n=1 Tax=Nonomuraea sp. NPDC050394 TaxID=3364363 RepID=UPI0037A311F4
MRTTVLDQGRGFPLCVEPRGRQDLGVFVTEHRQLLHENLAEHGAVLLRGFGGTRDGFAPAVSALADRLLPYVHGNSPRTKVSDAGIYTSTEYPAEFAIPLHNELSYAARWPSVLFLHCVTAPERGGQTPIADSREILRRLPPGVRRRFTERGVIYRQRLHGGVGLGRSWQQTYETGDRALVERHLRELGAEFSWTADGGLRTSQLRPATVIHPVLGEEVWFNQADQWHWTGAGPDTGEELLELLGEDDLPTSCRHGDGTPLAPEDLSDIRRVGRECAVRFDWAPGDLLMIDNVRVAHGREPYAGPRRILLAMA